MSNESASGKKIEPQVVLEAVDALKQKGWDINPYTVADEAKIPRSALYRNPELMKILSKARGEDLAGNWQEMLSQIESLQKQIANLEQQLAILEERNRDLNQLNHYWERHSQLLEAAMAELRCQHEELMANRDNKDHSVIEESVQTSQADALESEPEPILSSEISFPKEDDFSSAIPDQDGNDYNTAEPGFYKGLASGQEAESASPQSEARAKSTTLSDADLRDLLKHRFANQTEQSPAEKETKNKKNQTTRFVGVNRVGQEPPTQGFVIRTVPPDIRKSCLVLGLRPEELTVELVHKTWKKEMTREHPDNGGDTEMAVYLNTAKDTLYRWLEAQAPKLGKKFGTATGEFQRPAERQDNKA